MGSRARDTAGSQSIIDTSDTSHGRKGRKMAKKRATKKLRMAFIGAGNPTFDGLWDYFVDVVEGPLG